jgi:hypothetical protein
MSAADMTIGQFDGIDNQPNFKQPLHYLIRNWYVGDALPLPDDEQRQCGLRYRMLDDSMHAKNDG